MLVVVDPNHPKPAGNVGGNGSPGASNGSTSGGGGGAGAAGGVGRPGAPIPGSEPADNMGRGGIGVQVAIAGPSTASPVGTPGPSGNGWFAGGGGGGLYSNPTATSGPGSAPAAGGGSSRVSRTRFTGNAPYDPFSEPAERSFGFQSTWWWRWWRWNFQLMVKAKMVDHLDNLVLWLLDMNYHQVMQMVQKATGGAVSKGWI